jgi:capsular exopolysaccharide synthesis family protein
MLATTFDIDGEVGLTQVLAGDLRAEEAMVASGIDNLSLLPAGRIPPNPSELLGSLKMSQLIDELAKTHLVLLDAPPLLPVTDAALIAAGSDGAILVVRHGRTSREQAAQARARLDSVGANLLGTVLNFVPERGMGGYGYGYGYGNGYAPKAGVVTDVPAAPDPDGGTGEDPLLVEDDVPTPDSAAQAPANSSPLPRIDERL